MRSGSAPLRNVAPPRAKAANQGVANRRFARRALCLAAPVRRGGPLLQGPPRSQRSGSARGSWPPGRGCRHDPLSRPSWPWSPREVVGPVAAVRGREVYIVRPDYVRVNYLFVVEERVDDGQIPAAPLDEDHVPHAAPVVQDGSVRGCVVGDGLD